MTLLDAYALIAYLTAGPAAAHVRTILRDGDCAIATANLVEVLDVTQRVRGIPIGRVRAVIDPLLDGTLAIIPLDLPIARRAAELRATHYNGKTCAISLADAVLIASAQPGDRIATADPAVLDVTRVEGISTLPLPGEG